MRRLITICLPMLLLLATGCSEWRIERDANGDVRMIIRGGDSQQFVPVGSAIGEQTAIQHVGPVAEEWAEAEKRNTMGAWSDAMRACRAAADEAYRRAIRAKNATLGITYRSDEAFKELDK